MPSVTNLREQEQNGPFCMTRENKVDYPTGISFVSNICKLVRRVLYTVVEFIHHLIPEHKASIE